MIKRKADELIRNFLLNDKRSLLVTGARQVGKTFSVRKVNINFGSVFENLVAQELYAHGFSEAQQHSLYYFNSKKQGELDFVVEYASNVLPIEVKSGKDYERHNALSNVMENEDYAVPMAYVFCQENVQTKGRVIYYPIYMISFFEQIQAEEKVYKFDLTGLG